MADTHIPAPDDDDFDRLLADRRRAAGLPVNRLSPAEHPDPEPRP